MGWNRPGKNITVDIDGISVTFKPMTQGERIDYAYAISQLYLNKKIEDISPEDLKINIDNLINLIAGQIENIKMEGFEGTVKELLQWQSHDLLLKISNIIMAGSDMTATEEKN